MGDKVPCPKCGKPCGATYLLRHAAKCNGGEMNTGGTNMNKQLIQELAEDVKTSSADLKHETAEVDIKTVEINEGEPEGEPTISTVEGSDMIKPIGGIASAIGVVVVVLVVIAVMFMFGRGNNER